ncbi:MAG TPA: tetraacyldisaccharide 4'-kinase [Ramlibacter sp.]|nr:tetraacyldisaccharide 4'-kinase [Ramlibacter sp.]
MREALQRAWLRRGALACALWPLSLLFGAAAALRRFAYREGWLKTEAVGVPVIVVGNVVAGGSGKTPVVQAVVEHLKMRGLRVGIVSRGYGRKRSDCREVTGASDASDVGDEPLLLARACDVAVFVAPLRVDAARALLRAYPQTQVIVSDDGLQHCALRRDIEICVFDERGAGNGWLLPAGPLREHWPRKVDFVIGSAGFAVSRQLAGHAARADGSRISLEQLATRAVVAVAGIAKPHSFFDMLREAGLTVDRTIGLPDHYDFATPLDVRGEIVCTEKDAVKLWRTHPNAWAVPLEVQIDPAFFTALDAKLSSGNGSPTA